GGASGVSTIWYRPSEDTNRVRRAGWRVHSSRRLDIMWSRCRRPRNARRSVNRYAVPDSSSCVAAHTARCANDTGPMTSLPASVATPPPAHSVAGFAADTPRTHVRPHVTDVAEAFRPATGGSGLPPTGRYRPARRPDRVLLLVVHDDGEQTLVGSLVAHLRLTA